MSKNEIFIKETKNTKIWCVKMKNYKKHQILKRGNY